MYSVIANASASPAASGLIIADSQGKQLQETLNFPQREQLFAQKKGFILTDINGQSSCVAHGLSPGFETYATGWHSVIIQQLTPPQQSERAT